MTSRGCPHHCSFCYLTVYKDRKYRTIPHDTVLEDFDSVRDRFAVVVTDENFIGYSAKDLEDRKVLLEKAIRRNYKFFWGCQASTKLASEPELMKLMHRAGCRAVFMGFEAIDEAGLTLINKGHNLGLDSHDRTYPDRLIEALKASRADFPRVFYATAWPGTPLFETLEKEGRVNRNCDEVRKDVPSIKFKHFTHSEAVAARKKILDSAFNVRAVGSTLGRWVLRDRSLMLTYVKMAARNRIAELLKSRRSYTGGAAVR